MGQLVSDYYLMRQKNELDWIRSAVRAWGLLAEPAAPGDPPGSIPDDRRDLVRKKWVLAQLNYYISASYRDRILDLVFSQLAGGFLVASLATSFFVAFFEFYFYDPTNVPRWVTIVVAAFERLILLILLIVAFPHLIVKVVETDREAREDQEEITQVDSITQDHPEIKPAKKLPEFLKHVPFRPLYRLLGGDGAVRPGMRRVSWFSFGYGVVTGAAITLILLVMYHVLQCGPEVSTRPTPPSRPTTPTRVDGLDDRRDGLERRDRRPVAVVHREAGVRVALPAVQEDEDHVSGGVQRASPAERGRGHRRRQTAQTRLGIEALAEHADWLLMHRERPLELPRLEL